ncbi:MAG: hypothetical protein WD060_04375 [Pirellulales bacterium]
MHRLRLISCAAILAVMVSDCLAIEMFTYFGDGSRVGLPSLEVPIEAYPGIPLRSDRIRARRRALRAGPDTAVPVGPGTPISRGITIRAMPSGPVAAPATVTAPAPKAEPIAAPRPRTVRQIAPR